MASPADLSPRVGQRIPPPETWEGVIDRDADGFGPVLVVIPEFSGDLAHGPCPWMPVARPDGIYTPKRGDRCVVVIPHGADPWIVGWEPTATEPDETYE